MPHLLLIHLKKNILMFNLMLILALNFFLHLMLLFQCNILLLSYFQAPVDQLESIHLKIYGEYLLHEYLPKPHLFLFYLLELLLILLNNFVHYHFYVLSSLQILLLALTQLELQIREQQQHMD